jgi:hypothetical protein
LGPDWISTARKAVDAFRNACPTTGILAITDGPWSCDAARFDILRARETSGSKSAAPAPSRVIFSPNGAILREDSATANSFVGAASIETDGFSGGLEATVSRLRAIAVKLRSRGNPAAADIAHTVIAKLRRCACLPGSLAQLSEFLERETSAAIAADDMTAYRITSDLAALDDPRVGATQIAADELVAAETEARQIVVSSESATPMSSLLDETLAPAMRSSSRTIVILRNEMIADFACDRLSRRFENFETRLDRDVIRLTTRQGLADLAAFPTGYRNQFKRAIVVAPTRQSALEILSEPWLPDEVTFLADCDTLRFSLRDAARLAALLEQPELKRRFERFSAAANVRVEQIGAHVIEFDTAVRPTEDVDFPDGAVIDLTGSQRGDQQLIELHMQSGQRILARPRTGLVQRDDTHSARRFLEISASAVSVGDEICVIGPRFIEKARSLVNITAAAAEEIRDYHERVRKHFGELSAPNRSACLRLLCERMGEPRVSPTTASYWINLDEEAEKPLHEVIRFPGDQLALAMGGHQWKPALPFRVCRSLAR